MAWRTTRRGRSSAVGEFVETQAVLFAEFQKHVGSIGDQMLEPTGSHEKLVCWITFACYCFLRGALPYQAFGRDAPAPESPTVRDTSIMIQPHFLANLRHSFVDAVQSLVLFCLEICESGRIM